MIDLVDIERVKTLAARYLADRKRYEKLSERRDNDLTSKRAQKLNADLNWLAMALSKSEASLHAACADAGVADVREPDAYREVTFRPSGWHEYRFDPPKPRDFHKARRTTDGEEG